MSISIANPVTSVAVGNFDGMHLGHRALFERLDDGGAVVVVEHYRATLTPGLYRAFFARQPLFFYDFDTIRSLEPEAFITRLCEDFPRLKKIVVGEDFRFGTGRKGDASLLSKLFGGTVEVVGEVKLKGRGVHSRYIREELASGNLSAANEMLGRPYEVWGEPIRGQGLGSRELVPTLNLFTGRFLLPKAGVYKTLTRVADGYRPSVTFVGHRHTTDGKFAVETHLLGEERVDAKGEVSIRWLSFLRENRRFENLDALKRQIAKDLENAAKR